MSRRVGMVSDRLEPHDLEAEKAVLGAVLVSPLAWLAAASVARDRDFYRDAHRRVFAAMTRLVGRGVPIDLVTLSDELRTSGELDEVGGAAYLSRLTDGMPTTANAGHYAGIVREKARLRQVIAEANRLLADAYLQSGRAGDLVNDAVRRLTDTVEMRADGAISAGAAVEAYLEALVAGTAAQPIPTGHVDLDLLIGGLRPADFVVVAARPSVGKSSFMLGLAARVARAGKPTAVFSLEMRTSELAAQLVAWRSRVPTAALESGEASDAAYAKAATAAGDWQGVPLLLEGSSRSVTEVAAWCRRFKQEHGLACAFVDYLQLLVPAERLSAGHEELAATSHMLKRLAKDLGIPVVALSQLSRAPEARTDKRPHLADLRGSGALEQDCDLAMLLFREEMHKPKAENEGIAECIVAKNRRGPIGVVRLAFIRQLALFEDLAPGNYEKA